MTDPAGPEYASWFEGLLTEQSDRKASLEARGLSVITTSGGLSTLLFGLVALISGSDTFRLPDQADTPLIVALIAFVLAALLALGTNAPLSYKSVDIEKPDAEFWPYWGKGKDDALQRIVSSRIESLRSAKQKNGIKGGLLLAAMVCEVVAVLAVAVAVGAVLFYR